jgi:hypothetical protein
LLKAQVEGLQRCPFAIRATAMLQQNRYKAFVLQLSTEKFLPMPRRPEQTELVLLKRITTLKLDRYKIV